MLREKEITRNKWTVIRNWPLFHERITYRQMVTFYALGLERINASKIYICQEFYTLRYNSSCLRLKILFKTRKNLHNAFQFFHYDIENKKSDSVERRVTRQRKS